MRLLFALVLSCSLIVVDLASAQELGTWESYSSLRPVRFVDEDSDGRKWIATEGGLYSIVNGETDAIFTRTEGLYRLNPSAMAYHSGSGKLWIGYDDGMVESFDPDTELFQREDAIFRATQFTRRAVNSIRVGTDRI